MKYIHKLMILASMLHPQTKANQWQALNQDYFLYNVPSLTAQKIIQTPAQIHLYKQYITKKNSKKEFTKLTYCYGNLFHKNKYATIKKVRGVSYQSQRHERLQRYVFNRAGMKATYPLNHYSHLNSMYYRLAAIKKHSPIKNHSKYQLMG